MFAIKTRKQAAEAGEKRYYTGRPCGKGHDAQRFTSTGVCVKCAAGYVRDYNKRLAKQANAIAAGIFTYPLHPDDVAAALAYCQALDLQRGRAPHVPPAPVGAAGLVLPEHIARFRQTVIEQHAPPARPGYFPEP